MTSSEAIIEKLISVEISIVVILGDSLEMISGLYMHPLTGKIQMQTYTKNITADDCEDQCAKI